MKLQIIHTVTSPNRHRAELVIDADTGTKATSEFDFSIAAPDQERLRWYWENFLEYPFGSTLEEGEEAERRIAGIGEQLFQAVFQGSAAREIWNQVHSRLNATRIEIVCPPHVTGGSLPWELLRAPDSDTVLSAACESFVRVPNEGQEVQPRPAKSTSAPVRVLVVMCRPPGEPGTPFRSPAARLLRCLDPSVREKVRLDVLRPPTFGQLGSLLLEAEATGDPYDVLHIDGYAILSDIEVEGAPDSVRKHSREPQFTQVLPGPHGYLVFEGATMEQSCHLVDGVSLAELLKEAGVSVLTLAAMPLAGAGLQKKPGDGGDSWNVPLSEALSSVAHDTVFQGVPGALCLPYALDPALGARVLGRAYAGLAQGQTLGQLANNLRRQLRDLSDRQVTYGPVAFQDWGVPIVHERQPLEVVKPESNVPASLPAEVLTQETQWDAQLAEARTPRAPVGGFLGRYETILTIDRLFDTRSIVLLEGDPGQGKTATAAAFADWYIRTSGLDGPVLFTSFNCHKTLVGVLDQLAVVFREALEKAGYRWARIPPDERLEVGLHVLNQIPVLWIWDNFEKLDGVGGGPEWKLEEQEELANFLRLARETRAKVLLVSRSTEHHWLGVLPARISLPGLPMREALQLTRVLAERNGSWLTDVDDWTPALEFAGGKPLAVRCLVERIVREGLESTSELRALTDGLRAKTSADAVEGALQYALTKGLNENERRIFSLLHLFQEIINVRRLPPMSAGDKTASVPEMRSLPEFQEIVEESESTVLERAASQGLLAAEGAGIYSIHSALEPLLARLFNRTFPARLEGGKEKRFRLSFRAPAEESLPPPSTRGARAYVRTMSTFGLESYEEFKNGNKGVLEDLQTEEPNLDHACDLARRFEWWDLIAGAIHGLGALYEGFGRVGEWSRLVEELMDDCFDRMTQKPLEGREQYWRAIAEQGVHAAVKRQSLPRAEELQRLCLQWDRDRAEPLLSVPPTQLDEQQKTAINRWALSLHHLGEILRRQGLAERKIDLEAIDLKERLGDRETASQWAFQLGMEYTDDPSLRDLVQAERWLQRSLELKGDEEQFKKASCYAELGRVAWERFGEARKSNRPQVELLRHLNDARQYYLRAIENDPPGDWSTLASHNQEVGHICFSLGDLDRALPYYRESIRYNQKQGNFSAAAETQFTLALSLRDAGRLAEARRFAQDAHANFQRIEGCDPELIKRAQKIAETIEQRLEAQKQARIQ